MAKDHNQSTNGNFPSSDTQLDATPCHPKGMLVVIGGHEQKEGHRPILEVLAKRVGSGKLVVATLASEEPESQWKEYERAIDRASNTPLIGRDAWERRFELRKRGDYEVIRSIKTLLDTPETWTVIKGGYGPL